jgi:putative cell wall-binding protein
MPFSMLTSNRLWTTALALLLLFSAGLVGAQPAQAVGGETFVQLANQKRASVGKAAVGFSSLVDTIAVERANQMAKTDNFAHDMTYIGNRLKQLGACYSTYGEIIHYSTHSTFTYERPIEAWWNSTGHRNIMIGDYNAAGGSWARSSSTNRAYSVMIFVKLCQAPTTSSTPVSRISGSDRYATAASVSRAYFSAGVGVAYVATGANFPDALAAGAAAARARGPLLLVARDSIPSVTATELSRLAPRQIVVLGGSGVVSDRVLSALRSYTPGSVSRIAGADRYATAAAISRTHFAAGVPVAYIATGVHFPDALGGSAAAGTHGGPVLLVTRDGVPDVTRTELARLKPKRVVILGGSGVISDKVRNAVASYTTGSTTRLAGTDRYATAIAISSATHASGSGRTVFIVTGKTHPDGLAGGPVAGRLPGPVLLVPGDTLPSGVATELRRLAPQRVIVLGGTGSVSNSVLNAIAAALP